MGFIGYIGGSDVLIEVEVKFEFGWLLKVGLYNVGNRDVLLDIVF